MARVSRVGDQKTPTILMPAAPATALWEMSLAAYLRHRTDLPSLALKPLGLLDRYGEVAVGPDHMAFDGEDVPWAKTVRLVVRDLVDVVSDKAMAREAERIRHMLPPVPGRKWVVDHAMALLGEFAAPRLTKTRGGDVVSEVVYRGAFGREKSVQAGVFAALAMATWPEVRQSLIATARLHDVEVCGEAVARQALSEHEPDGRAALAPSADMPTLIVPAQSERHTERQPEPAGEELSVPGGAVMPPRADLGAPAEPQPEG